MAPLETASEAADHEPEIYPWKAAPSHLKTRRQLRAAGLAPGGHAPVAQTETRRRGRRLLAYLYDARLAVPKRTASPAQLLAVAKAIREHQARAAERHGYDRDELTTTEDPGPGWTSIPETTTAHEEAITMSDTTIRDAATWQLGVPTGYAQRIAHVLAIAGVNQARHTRTRLQRDDDQAREHGPAAIELFEIAVGNQIGAAEDRLEQIVWDNQWALTSALADALTWHDTSEIADQKLTELCDAFAHQWGVNIDTEQMQVGIDPDFDAIGAQSRAQAAALFARQSAAIGIIEDLPLAPEAKPVVGQALLRWRGESLDEAPTYALSSAEQRRAQLDTDLDAAGLTTDDRTRVDFVVDYLTGDTRNIDLLTSPVFVDPGEEARGRIPELLAGFDEGHVTAKQMAAEIAVMTAEDQARVREVGKAIRDGQYPDLQLWPGYADRDKLTEQLSLLAGDVEDLRATADYLAENDISNESPETWGVGDETAATIERLRERSDEIVAAATLQHGLADIERRQLTAIVDDVAAGDIQGRKDLPELLFTDERSKRVVDQQRISAAAAEIANGMRDKVDEILAATEFDRHSREGGLASFHKAHLRDTLHTVADGAIGTGVDHERRRYADLRVKFAHALANAGVDTAHRDRIRAVVDASARQAGIAGQAAADRDERWAIKSERIAMIRDDQPAQRRAAAAGRAAPPQAAVSAETMRACAARIDQSMSSGRAAGPVGLRQSHEIETGIER